ncbi:MAG: hypothetical protein P8H03_00845, partial [Emcibacteraceae bacterium]|nr:hypothetical protein [Emcibacteraceae bacterium]
RAVGRSMKVAPEEYLGMMVAVETALKHNEAADMEHYNRVTHYLAAEISALEGVTTEVKATYEQGMEPYVNVEWDADIYKITKDELKLALRNGEPCIELRALFLSFGELHITGHMLKPGEEKTVARRVKEVLNQSKAV